MIHRAEHKDNFTTIANATIRNPDLTDGAKVLLVYMLTCSDDWKFSVKGLAYTLGVSEGVIKDRIRELKKNGYVRTKKIQNEKGFFGQYDWEVFEVPSIRGTEKPTSDKTDGRKQPTSDKTEVGKNDPIRNNNIKEITNIKKYQYKESAIGIFQNVRLTNSEQEELINRYGIQEVGIYIDRLSTYMNENPEKHYKNHKSTIEKWIIQDKERKAI